MVDILAAESGSRIEICALERVPLVELVSLRNQIDAELKSRGHVRTASSVAGELMERVVTDAYAGELLKQGAKSADVRLADGSRIQVKTRSLPPGDERHWAFKDLDFDLAVVIRLDRETFRIDWARELSTDQVAALARHHERDGLRLRMASVRSVGKDVTELLSEAYAALQ